MPEVKELAKRLGELKIEYNGPESHGIVRLASHLTRESLEALARVALEFCEKRFYQKFPEERFWGDADQIYDVEEPK